VYALQVALFYQTVFVSIVHLQNTGITRIKLVKDVLILSFMTNKNSNACAQSMSHIFFKEDAFLVIYHIIGTQTLANVFHVLLRSSIIIKQEDVSALHKDLIW